VKLLAKTTRVCCRTARIAKQPTVAVYRAVRRAVDYARELHDALKAGLSDRSLHRAAKAYGNRNVFQEIG
jgi:hypothetical protein